MFEAGGTVYVYRIYGVHNCFNVTSGPCGRGEAVLVRSIEPVGGIDIMRRNRGLQSLEKLCSGPGKLCQALSISMEQNGISLNSGGSVEIRIPKERTAFRIDETPRIGITKAVELKRRFVIQGSRWVKGRLL